MTPQECGIEDIRRIGVYIAVIVVCAIIELWLGRTEKIKANSILELVFMATLTLIFWISVKLKGKKNDGNPSN